MIEGDDRGIQASKDYMVSAGGNLARYSLTPSAGAGAGASYTISKRPFTGTVQGSVSGSMKVDMPIVAPSVHGQKVYNLLLLRYKHYYHVLISLYIYMYIFINSYIYSTAISGHYMHAHPPPPYRV